MTGLFVFKSDTISIVPLKTPTLTKISHWNSPFKNTKTSIEQTALTEIALDKRLPNLKLSNNKLSLVS